ncbi:MAG: GNAT family N-acetyltransferase [Lachnospiraceae bacterium]|nr:GNAT family N-acetyltransferase [Lachnospiraceae bacterium]
MEIRRAGAADLEGVKKLLDQVNLVHHIGRPDLFKKARKYSDEQILEIFEDDSRPVFAAVDENDRVLGYAFCEHIEHKNEQMLADIKTLYIDDICVDEEMRGKHIGTEIYEYVKKYAVSRDCHNITLNVWSLNPAACAFYKSLGMEVQKYGMETIL